jgi:hypothetical protein
MFARYLKSQLMVLLCGGLVGPIFLVTFFLVRNSFGVAMWWMFYTGLFITALDVLIALWLTSFTAKSAAQTTVLEQSGVLALARITGMGETRVRINEQQLISLNLHIEGPGITPFDTQTRVTAQVTRMGNFSKGRLVVLVDPATNKYQIDWQRSALVNGLVPAEITVAEDNKTYDLSGQAEPLMEIFRMLQANGVPLNQMMDLRSNPGLRQQLLAIVRRSAAQSPQPAASSAMPAMAPMPREAPLSISQRLQELETLRATGAVSDDEYKAKRAQIIAQI